MLEDSNVRTDLKEDKMGTAFKFVEMDKNTAPSGEDAKNICVDFGANYSTFSYDADKHVYMKNYQNKPHMDSKTNEQLQFENLIILETKITPYPTDSVLKYVDWEGGENAKGYYISEGKMVPITWSKAGMYDPRSSLTRTATSCSSIAVSPTLRSPMRETARLKGKS